MKEQAAVVATSQIIAFSLEDETYAVPIEQVKEVVETQKLTPVPGTESFILGVINLRGKIIPILSLEELFELDKKSGQPAEHIIITEADEENSFGIQVDRVSEVIVIPSDSIKPAPKISAQKISEEYVKGVVILEAQAKEASSEKVLLLLDLKKIITTKIKEKLDQAVEVTADTTVDNELKTNGKVLAA
jgi:purine-binding chemotaxis protein CheW